MVNVTAQRGGMGTIGVFAAPESTTGTPFGNSSSSLIPFPVVEFFTKGLTWGAGPVDPKLMAPYLEKLVSSGVARPDFIVSQEIGIDQVPEYYRRFDEHLETKVIVRFP
jgi:threonine dehydrogenase-like Zn-dependent dehydrogenase